MTGRDRPGQARETKHTAALLFFCVNADGAEGKSAAHAPLLTYSVFNCVWVCASVVTQIKEPMQTQLRVKHPSLFPFFFFKNKCSSACICVFPAYENKQIRRV